MHGRGEELCEVLAVRPGMGQYLLQFCQWQGNDGAGEQLFSNPPRYLHVTVGLPAAEGGGVNVSEDSRELSKGEAPLRAQVF